MSKETIMKSQKGWCRKQGCCCESSRTGLSVRNHSSSVEEADANHVTSSLKGTAKAEASQLPKTTQLLKEEEWRLRLIRYLLRNQLS